jgi:hypothetical protein
MMEEVNSTTTYYKNICECHNVPLPSTIKKENQGKENARQ